MHDLIRRAEALHADETDADLLWAEIHRLRAAVQGPDGYTTWQEAATAERVRRVAAENALKAQQPREPVSAEAARLGLQFCCGNSERLHDEIGKLRNVVQRGMIAKCPAVFEAWNYHFPDDQREVPPLPETRWLAHGIIDGKRVELRGWHEDDLDAWVAQVRVLFAQEQVKAQRIIPREEPPSCPEGHGTMSSYFGGWRCNYCGCKAGAEPGTCANRAASAPQEPRSPLAMTNNPAKRRSERNDDGKW